MQTFSVPNTSSGKAPKHIYAEQDFLILFHPGISVRLVNGTGDTSGIVEITRMGLAGKMCVTNFTAAAASVVCKQLSFMGGIAYGYTTYRLDLPVWVTAMNCTGQETSIAQCVTSVWGKPNRFCFSNHVLCYRRCKLSAVYSVWNLSTLLD